MRRGLGVFSALFVIIGFSMIHGATYFKELAGAVFIALGVVILFFVLFFNQKK